MPATSDKPGVLLQGRLSGVLDRVELKPSVKRSCRIWVDWPAKAPSRLLHQVFVLSYLRDLHDRLETVTKPVPGQKRFLLFQDDTPIESVVELLSELDVRTPSRLHLARLEVDTEETFVGRFLSALSTPEGEGAIIDAWWDGDELVVISPMLERLRIPSAKLPKLSDVRKDIRHDFEIDPYGAFLYWPRQEVHMGWSQFQQLVDPQALLRAQQKSTRFNRRYGQAIRKLREEHSLSQAEIKGLDPRTIRRIEKGETRATSNALTRLAAAHRLDTNVYMNELAQRMARQA